MNWPTSLPGEPKNATSIVRAGRSTSPPAMGLTAATKALVSVLFVEALAPGAGRWDGGSGPATCRSASAGLRGSARSVALSCSWLSRGTRSSGSACSNNPSNQSASLPDRATDAGRRGGLVWGVGGSPQQSVIGGEVRPWGSRHGPGARGVGRKARMNGPPPGQQPLPCSGRPSEGRHRPATAVRQPDRGGTRSTTCGFG